MSTTYEFGTKDDYQLTEDGKPIGSLASNCSKKRREIENRFDVSKFGSCNHPTKADATAYAFSTLLALVVADGGVVNTQAGARKVKHRAGPIRWNTYLSYAAGDQV